MRRIKTFAAAVAVAVGGIGFGTPSTLLAEESPPPAQQKSQEKTNQSDPAKQDSGASDQSAQQAAASQKKDQSKPSGVQKRDRKPVAFMLIVPVPVTRPMVVADSVLAPDVEQIRDTLGSATEAALTPGGLDDLMERFVDADRNRMGKSGVDDKEHDTLNAIVNQIRQSWKSKYGGDFDVDDEMKVFAPFPVVQGEIGNRPQLAASTIGTADRLAGNDAGDVNLDPGRNVALVSVPQTDQQRELSVLLIHELPDNWKIDVPDNVSARDLQVNLQKHLSAFATDTAKWPATEAEAYRRVSHHVLAAVMGHAPKAPQSK